MESLYVLLHLRYPKHEPMDEHKGIGCLNTGNAATSGRLSFIQRADVAPVCAWHSFFISFVYIL